MYYSRKPDLIAPIYTKWEKPFDLGQLDSRSFWQHINEEIGKKVNWQKLNKATYASYKPIPGTIQLIKRLKQVSSLALLSNTREEWFNYVNTKFKITKHFDETFLSFQLKHLKPEPAVFNIVINKLHTNPQNIIMIDDNKKNIKAAVELGIDGYLFQNAFELEYQLNKKYFHNHLKYDHIFIGLILIDSQNNILVNSKMTNQRVMQPVIEIECNKHKPYTDCALEYVKNTLNIDIQENQLKEITKFGLPNKKSGWDLYCYYLFNPNQQRINLKQFPVSKYIKQKNYKDTDFKTYFQLEILKKLLISQ
jgi:HAD superfamily hydrolase (TIGR01509 family)